MNSLIERKGFAVTLFQTAGAWVWSNIYILYVGRMGFFVLGVKKMETPRVSKREERVSDILRFLFQCLRGIMGTFSKKL